MALDPRYFGPPHRLQPEQDPPGQLEPDRLLQARLLELRREQWRGVCRSSPLPFAIEALAPKGMRPAALPQASGRHRAHRHGVP